MLSRIAVRYAAAVILALSTAACGEGETVLPSPTVLVTTANTVCGTQISSIEIDVDYSGPILLIDVKFASEPEPLQVEIERYLANGATEPVALLENVSGRVRLDLAFNTKYRARARGGSCAWSPWVDRQIGPPNPCGGCAAPPPPPPPPPDDPEECEPEGEQEGEWSAFLRRTLGKSMEAPEEPEGCRES